MITTVTLNPSLDMTWQLERFSPDEINTIEHQKIEAGGRGLFISRLLHSWDAPTLALSFAGGRSGEQLRQLLQQERVPNRLIPLEEESKHNYTIIIGDKNEMLHFQQQDSPLPRHVLNVLSNSLLQRLEQGDYLAFSGTKPPGVLNSNLMDVLYVAHSRGCFLALDCNILSLEELIQIQPFVIKPSLAEFGQMMGGMAFTSDAEILQTARNIVNMGLPYVLVSMSERGLLGVSAHEAYHIAVPPVNAARKPGNGDAAFAGWLHSYSINENFEMALINAAACGTAMAAMEGTDLPPKHLIDEVLKQVISTKLPD